ncbi:zinc-dependent metalloprotease [Thalassotalea psychrophila]|uniref:Zinc-dependent metalloprotease n=1 Tax=Thalassotalea psychrophila TaxID=3065647 RepID=A0ABY9TSH2_9GAMM|nr:zinc-dependent metalloprotease [Colwelliaceae bacterium SQ149]
MKRYSIALMFLFTLLFGNQFAQASENFKENKTFHSGFIPFYLDGSTGNVYLEISDFNQQFLFQSSMPHGLGSNDIGLDRGQLGQTRLVQFEKVGNKVFLRQLNTYYRADSDNTLERQAIDEAFATSIIWGFKVEKVINNKVVIDYTPFLLSDIHNLSASLKSSKQGNYSIDATRSGLYEKRTKAFVDNTELEAIVTFKGKDAGKHLRSVTPDANAVTVNFHHSLIRLPDAQYQPRKFHTYSGMWSVEYADYASNIDAPLLQRVIPRHRLTKKNPDAELSEAVEPIIYYLDPGVPEPVRSALIDGALWWDQAFSAIGYKNAFQVKMLPEDADPMDIRYNVIQWVHRATRGWSYGASVVDPRTGEILKGHVTLGSLRVRQDYLIALGLTSPFKSSDVNTTEQKEMALARIRQLSAHEVGHTLGIAHNFSASVNNRASVMDYPHPLITLDAQGDIDLSNAYAADIGVWDKHVINYAYADFNNEQQGLAQVIKTAKEQGLQYMSDPDSRPKGGAEASGHLWDNGEDPVAELTRVMAVRAKALSNFGINSIEQGTPFSELEDTLVPVYNFHRYQVEAAAKVIAGVNYSYAVKGEDDIAQSVVSAEKQQAAINALLATLEPEFLTLSNDIISLIPPKAYGYYRSRESFRSNTSLSFDPVTAAQASAKYTLSLMLTPQRLARLNQQHMLDNRIPSVHNLIAEVIIATIKQDSKSGLSSAVQQRINQQVLDSVLALFHNDKLVAEVRSQVYANLLDLQSWLKGKTSYHFKSNSLYPQYHLLQQQIAFSLQQGKTIINEVPVSMPPGSPIGASSR